jgi:hypothetical protein
MRGKIVLTGLLLGLTGMAASAQKAAPTVPAENDIYCSGVITTEAVPHDTVVITGEQSNYKIVFNEGDYVYINKGSDQGVKPGDEFSIVRSMKDPYGIEWTKWEWSIMKKMGTFWEDEGRVKVISARQGVSIAQIEHECDYIQRDDIALPFTERPAPPLKPQDNFDRFAPADGKAMAMIITGKKFQAQVGGNDIVYVNLGADQHVKVGDYFRIFRFHGTQHEINYQTPRYSFDMEQGDAIKDVGIMGFGVAPKKYNWANTPREDLGEGIVLRTGPNSSTVLITFALREIFPGDYVEIE